MPPWPNCLLLVAPLLVRRGSLILFALGSALCVASWTPALTNMAISLHIAVYLLPYITPLIWLLALAWMGRSWPYLAASLALSCYTPPTACWPIGISSLASRSETTTQNSPDSAEGQLVRVATLNRDGPISRRRNPGPSADEPAIERVERAILSDGFCAGRRNHQARNAHGIFHNLAALAGLPRA